MENRFKNVGLWISMGSLLMLIMGNYGLYSYIGMDANTFKQAFDMVLGILITGGILSNPTSGKMFLDKKEEE